ncbi:hypothetical protein PC123_g22833 [Phytophthora cactorum]|nr:hypothetical protein PC123_g22833 [Phytophthora cactorum]
MGHADGLSRLFHRPGVAGAIRMSDLLNADENDAAIKNRSQTEDGTINRNATDVPVAVEEPNVTPTGELAEGVAPSGEAPMGTEPLTQAEQEEDQQGRTQEADPSPIDAFGLACDKFVAEQERVPSMRALKAFLNDSSLDLDPQLRVSVRKMSHHYLIRNAVLMRRVHGERVPVQLELFALPLSRYRSLRRWKKDVDEYVQESSICSGGKGRRPWRAGLMQRMPVQDLSGPFALLVVDAIEPLVVTPRGNKYILVFVDYYTRWASLDTIAFVDAMVEGAICRHGVPERLLSDPSSNITSNLARSLYEPLGIKKLFGSAYHPPTQGLVERFNGTLMDMLRMYVSETQTDWDEHLPRVLFAYRTAYHEGMGDTPFFSLYGRGPVLSIDLAFLNTRKDWKSNEVAVYRRKLYYSLRDSRRLRERQLIKAQDRDEKQLDKQVRVTYADGDAA